MRSKHRRLSLQLRINLVVMAIILISIGIQTLSVRQYLEDYIIAEGEKKVMHVAGMMSRDERVISAFALADPASVIQPTAETIRLYSGTSFVVVFNMEAIRYSHPVPERIGQHFVGGDEQAALSGKQYVSQAVGTLGLSLRAFVPILAPAGFQIGAVSVGLLLEDLREETRKLSLILYSVAAVSLLIGSLGAFFLSGNIKKTIFGLEPHEIAALLEERNVIISSIKEGIVAIDRTGRVILINDNAKKLLSIDEISHDTKITDLLPNTRLPAVIESGAAAFDEEQIMKDAVVLVNRIPLVAKGEIIGAVATFRDMSEIRKLAEELTAVRQYTEALRAQHHEFLNKLHVISGLLQMKRYDEAVRYTVNTVSSKQRLFDFLRMSIATSELSALILARINEAQESDIDVRVDEHSRFPFIGEELVNPLVAIVGNILQNSIEALRLSSRNGKMISLAFEDRADEVVIRIGDNGDGIPAHLRGRIFERGVTSKSGAGNMGFGLYLVKMHVERLSGSVEIVDGDGVTTIVRLPKNRLKLRTQERA